MSKIQQFAPQIIWLLLATTLCMTYFVSNVVLFQIVLYSVVFVLFLLSSKTTLHSNIALCNVLFIVFGILYLVRAFIELKVLGHKQGLFNNDFSVLFFIAIGMILPALFVPSLKTTESYRIVFLIVATLIAVSLSISLYNIFSGNIIYTPDYRIQANKQLGVIEYGHLGLTGIITGFLSYLYYDKKILKLFGLLYITIGVFSMLMAGTRGAFFALFVIIAVFVFSKFQIKSFVVLALLIGVVIIFFDPIINLFDSLGSHSVSRLVRFLTQGGDQSSGRFGIWKVALSQLSESPFMGVSCFFNMRKSVYVYNYVHNSLIEVAYALGVVGLFVFLQLNCVAFKATIVAIKSRHVDSIAFALLYLQYFTFVFFSSSIIRVPLFWFFLSMMLNVRNKQLKNEF